MVRNYTRVGSCLSRATKLRQRDRPRKSRRHPMPTLWICRVRRCCPGSSKATRMFLHAYSEATWNDQVTNESYALRVVRATVHAQRTLLPGSPPSAIWGLRERAMRSRAAASHRPRHHSGRADRSHARVGGDRQLRPKLSPDLNLPQGRRK